MANTPASSSKQAAQAKPKGSAYCKGPPDHLLVVRYACFVPMAECSELFADRSLYHKKTFRGFPAKVIPMKSL